MSFRLERIRAWWIIIVLVLRTLSTTSCLCLTRRQEIVAPDFWEQKLLDRSARAFSPVKKGRVRESAQSRSIIPTRKTEEVVYLMSRGSRSNDKRRTVESLAA